jgi:hypothetical protein
MDKQVRIQGGGTEGEEWTRCTQKVMPTDPWWRHFPKPKVFITLQEAMNDIS